MLVKVLKRLRRKNRIKKQISNNSSKLRLSVYRSNTSIYAQIIDDVAWKTLCASSDLAMTKEGTKVQMATKVGEDIAKKALALNLKDVVFDRGWFLYHGRVKALADAARATWLNF